MKRKTLSKIITSALSVVLLTSVLAGCGSKNTTNDQASSGETTTVSNADEPGWKADTDPITFDWYLNFSWFANQWGVDTTSKYITEKTGVNVNYIVPAGNENEKLNTLIASGDLPDILTLGWWEDGVDKMIEGDLVYALNELADEYDPYFFKVADDKKLGWYTEENGNVYQYPNASSSPEDFEKYSDIKPSNQTFLVRKDMYEAIGSPDMSTQEGFLAALEAAKEMFPEVNGQPIIPLGLHQFTEAGNYSLEDYLQNFLAIPREKDGKLYDVTTDPEYISWLKTFREANELGLLSQDVFIDQRPQMEEKIAQGRYFAMLYQRSDMAAPEQALYQNDPESVYIAVDGPANSAGDEARLSGDGISGWTVTLISKSCEDPERAIEFLTYLISEEGQKDVFLGQEGITWQNIDGKDQFKPEVLELLNSDRTAFDKQYGASNTFWMLMDTNMMLQWTPETAEPFKQMEDWTKGKTVSYAQFDNINPAGDTTEGINSTKISNLWGETLPKLLLAGSDEEFDEIFSAFIEKRESYDFAGLLQYKQGKYEENLAKLGL
ncbi:extracellular solute-binding protein [Clostridium grantii]|uniref:Putative aldouronate transport system substrate-binding protein n=1 Tax=Clostridium grantii DSM 8605 TaxID=1121316 RepID=A0A1M5VZQ0_9CLOT|nr:extracellular solute-binding protein [Clostridium grantii]SHH80413.1 putative aldouronate transport system substrate-binding protein [Clostridium grantii DSM 8605]